LFLDNVKYFCQWAKKNAPEQPLEIYHCSPDAKRDLVRASSEFDAWWARLDADPTRKDELSGRWSADLAVHTEQKDRAEAARKKAAAEKRRQDQLAAMPTMPIANLCGLMRGPLEIDAYDQLLKRGRFHRAEMDCINRQCVKLGMTEEAMFCALGSARSAQIDRWVLGASMSNTSTTASLSTPRTARSRPIRTRH
jgi:hypothetical protein